MTNKMTNHNAPPPDTSDDTEKDTQRLDFIDRLEIPEGYGWRVYRSSTGRGWRLATTGRQPNFPTPRQAIDFAMVSDLYGFSYDNID
jgi:hypothetical protein